MSNHFDVIVIGAGAAGLMASLQLARAGQRVLVVEARERIGGRILTRHHEVPLELGAEFVHGRPEVTWDLLRESGLESRELVGTPYRYTGSGVRPAGDEPDSAFETLEAMCRWYAAQPADSDLDFESYLARAGIAGAQAEKASRYVEGFNAADQSRISVAALARQQAAEDAIQADRLFHVATGYDALPRYLAEQLRAAGGELRLSYPVHTVDWSGNDVKIRSASSASTLQAMRVVVTVPLGVLKSGALQFAPMIPGLSSLLQGLEMGPVHRITLLFEQPFWSDVAEDMLFLFSPDGPIPTWWTSHPSAAPVLTGWIGGAAAMRRAHGLRQDALIEAALRQLSEMFRRSASELRARLRAALTHDWMEDPWARGAYSYATVGGVDSSSGLAQDINGAVFFAGEHTDTQGHWGTVHAALASGRRVARQLLSLA